MKGSPKARAFFTSFFCTLCILLFAMGIVEVDYNSRHIGFGDNKTILFSLIGKNYHIGCFIPKI